MDVIFMTKASMTAALRKKLGSTEGSSRRGGAPSKRVSEIKTTHRTDYEKETN